MQHNNKTILTIEDDPDVRQSISAFYKDYGYAVLEAENGRQGLELFDCYKPDLVFTDLMMPEVGGLQVVSEIALKSPETPVIVISGTGEVRDSVEALRRGAWDYITKPVIDFGELELAIQRAFERVELHRNSRLNLETMQRKLIEQSAHVHILENHDMLTGLPNRQYLQQMFYKTVIEAKRFADVSILLLGIDSFKFVNEALGHDCGDMLLRMLSERLKAVLSPDDVLARLGGDQFVILVADCNSISQLILEIMNLFNSPFEVAGQEIFLAVSAGIAIFPQDGGSLERLIQNADSALSTAKSSGKNRFVYYSHDLSAKAQERLQMETHLHHALERNEFILHYQLQNDAATRKVTGMEVLLRWKPSNEERLVSPAVFVPILEETALIVAVGEWVLRTACNQYVRWRSQGLPPLRLSVNISACQFHHGNLPEIVRDVLESSGMEPSQLCLEITESVVVKDIEQTVVVMKTLADMGVELSMDDFGTGYSSLSYLSKMPLNELKIDRAFVMNLPDDRNAVSIVESILEMARGMGLNVVAEGVETRQQADLLQAKGCQQLQGYLFSRPVTSEEVGRCLGMF